MGCSEGKVGDLPMTEWENWVNVLQSCNLLLMELWFYLMMLSLESKCDQFDNFRKGSLRIEEVGLDVWVGGFDSRGCSMVKLSDFLCPSICKPRSKGNPGLLNIFNELTGINCCKSWKRRIKFTRSQNFDQVGPVAEDFPNKILVLY